MYSCNNQLYSSQQQLLSLWRPRAHENLDIFPSHPSLGPFFGSCRLRGGSSCAAPLKHFCPTHFTAGKCWDFLPLTKPRWVPVFCCTLNSLGLCKEQALIRQVWAQRDQSPALSCAKAPLYQCKGTLKARGLTLSGFKDTFFTILPWNSGIVWLVGCLFSGKLSFFFKREDIPPSSGSIKGELINLLVEDVVPSAEWMHYMVSFSPKQEECAVSQLSSAAATTKRAKVTLTVSEKWNLSQRNYNYNLSNLRVLCCWFFKVSTRNF